MGTIKRTFANSLTGTGKLSATNLDSNIPANNIADASVTNVSALSPSLGSAIPSVASDPPSPTLGDIWYNSSTGKLKNYGFTAAAFSAGANIPINKGRGATCGTKAAALLSHGNTGPGPQPLDNQTLEYNGTTWGTGGNSNSPRRVMAGAGVQTSALAFSGSLNPNNPGFPPSDSNKNESYNGTSWTNETGMPYNSGGSSGAGTSETAILGFGGGVAPTYTSTNTISWNGSSWTAENAMNTASYALGGAGSQTAALKVGRYGPVGPDTNQAEEYDGTSWTNVTAASNARANNFATGGPQTSAFTAGGKGPGSPSPNIADAESYDGTSWAAMATLALAGERGGSNSTDSSPSAYIIGGAPYNTSPGPTEEFTAATAAVKTVTTS